MEIKTNSYRWIFTLLLMLFASSIFAQNVEVGKPLPLWSEGYLDIHAINTARGESTFFMLPDGTTLLVDAGEFVTNDPNMAPQRPNENVAPGETIAKYITYFMKPVKSKSIDYMLLTHFHADHMGFAYKDTPWASNHAYRLSGVTSVGDKIPFKKVIDRGWPDYQKPIPPECATTDNYINFLKWQVSHNNLKVEQFAVGVDSQLVLNRHPAKYPTFNIRNIAANGYVWTGLGDVARNYFLPSKYLSKEELPNENECSIAFRLSYGKFDYFSGADIPAVTDYEWQHLEGPIGFVTGPVEACKSCHHMNYDAIGLTLLQALRPQVIVVQGWKAQQPDICVLRRVLSKKSYPGKKSVFVTNLQHATEMVAYPNTKQLAGSQGHIVIRVLPGGNEFYVYVLDDTNDKYEVKSVHGPYKCN